MRSSDTSDAPSHPVVPWRLGLGCYAASSVLVILAVVQIYAITKPKKGDLPAYFARWDGESYVNVCRYGYGNETPERSYTLAFFPGYPLMGRLFNWLPGVSTELALLLVSNLCLAASCVLLACYVRQRWPDRPELSLPVVLALCLAPTGFYFRMALSEALFLLLLIGTLYALLREAPLWSVALLIGLATGVRLVGVVLAPIFLLHVWRRSPSVGQALLRAALLAPLTVWGIGLFMLFNYLTFGDPLSYARSIYSVGTDRPPEGKLLALLLLEPFWCNCVPSSPCYWGKQDSGQHPWLGLFLLNPVWFGATAVLVAVGGWKGWLQRDELLLSAGLLLVPYVSRSYEMCMGGFARYAVVVFPVYLVVGRLLLPVPRLLVVLLILLCTVLLGFYSAKFALNFPFFY